MVNRIINGDMRIDQRGVVATTHTSYVPDRFRIIKDTSDGTFTMQQSSVAPAGFTNSALFTVGTAYTPTVSANNFYRQGVEGFNIADLNWGSANAAPITLSFWVRASVTGLFGGALRNGDSTRSYPFSYTIAVANTWEQKIITVVGDTTGNWLTTTGVGIDVGWGLSVGSSFSGTAGAWAAGNYISATGATYITSTAGATFYITGVQLEKGSTATDFEYVDYSRQLQQCQRYYETSITGAGSRNSDNYGIYAGVFKTTKRANPSVSYVASGAQGGLGGFYLGPNLDGFVAYSTSTNASSGNYFTYTATSEL
tara:strand:- start:112 stop:1044 length:933 start_codon:yes stop_codon:yes gene_type:complete